MPQAHPVWWPVVVVGLAGLAGAELATRARRPAVLESYTQIHLEEEMRGEAFVKDWPAFVRFLRLAAA